MTTAPDQWSGDLLDDPELMKAFAMQLRGMLADNAEWIARIRRDAEAMWDANPPSDLGTFEQWWRTKWMRSPLRKIQEHLEEAAAQTHHLEARTRKVRHELPQARRAAKAAVVERQTRPELGSGEFGRRQPAPREEGGPRPMARPTSGGDFMDLISRQGGQRGDRSGRSA